jgi:pyruvyltransferase
MHDKIGICYYTKEKNFGDVLNEYIPLQLFNCNIYKENIYQCDAAFIGSILTLFMTNDALKIREDLTPLTIWGSGLIRPIDLKNKPIRKLDIRAVRGRLTRNILSVITNSNLSTIPLGDPGLLCSRVFTNLDATKEYEYGIIPHYIDVDNENLKKLQLPNSIILDITEEPIAFLSKMLKCKKIISSAMHGLIAADSFNIPNIRMILSDNIVGGDFKYNDYYSAFGFDHHEKLDLRTHNGVITNLKFKYKITPRQVESIQNALIRSFPYA